MDLQHPERKMSKSIESPLGTVTILDSPEEITQKVRKAVTDTDGEIRYDPVNKPGVSNLLELLAAATSRSIDDVTAGHNRYGTLKADVADALVAALAPVKARYEELSRDSQAISSLLEKGAEKASDVASVTLRRAKEAIGLLAPEVG
jgi:tryptophanyl-tRNA synthetase